MGRAILLRPSTKVGEHEKSEQESHKPKMIGFVAVVREGEIGYRIHPDWWGQGYMSEALAMFLDMFWKTESKCNVLLPSRLATEEEGWDCQRVLFPEYED